MKHLVGWACLLLLVSADMAWGQAQDEAADTPVMRPVVSDELSPIVPISPVASDGHVGKGFLRKPPGSGPFPAVVLIHGGATERSSEQLREFARHILASRFLYEGYVIAAITYRRLENDPRGLISVRDGLAAVEHVKALPYVDPESVVLLGASGGGNFALEIASATAVAAIVSEEPASTIMAGLQTTENMVALRNRDLGAIPDRDPVADYRSKEDKQEFLDIVARIHAPILIIEGAGIPFAGVNRFNSEVLVPELRAAGKDVDVLRYDGEFHGFLFNSAPPNTRRAQAALDAFEQSDAFFRRHIRKQPERFIDFAPVPADP